MEVPSNPPSSVALSSGHVSPPGWSDLLMYVPEAGLCSLHCSAPSRLGGGGGDDAIIPRTR